MKIIHCFIESYLLYTTILTVAIESRNFTCRNLNISIRVCVYVVAKEWDCLTEREGKDQYQIQIL